MTLRKTIYGSDQMTRGNILDEVASFKEGKRQTCWFFALLASLFMLVPSATVGFASTSPTTGADAFRAPVQAPKECVKGFLWLEAEGFSDYGEWKLDTQFVHKMGSAYLLAAGVGKPVGSARTGIQVPSDGRWFAWARTKDWLPEHHPGTFRVVVNEVPGEVLGRSGKEGWRWERAGEWYLKGGAATVSLEDLSGAFARCDALVLTKDPEYVPPDDSSACVSERSRLAGVDAGVVDGGGGDFVVVGAGTGGLSAAIAAARHGADVLLVHDRPVLGGNASSELGVPICGAAVNHVNAREGGLCEEVRLTHGMIGNGTLSTVFRQMAESLPNLRVRYNSRVEQVEKEDGLISSVIARDTLTGKRTRYRGKLFLDGTGDGWIGLFAGAEMLHGREGIDEYGEYPAPKERDEMLMSGCLMGGTYLGYRHRATDRPDVPFHTPTWARVLPEGFTRWTPNGNSQWWVEHSGRFSEMDDPERARDELVRINLAYWGWLKNEWGNKRSIASHEIYEMAYMIGRREGYRIRGDYVLNGNDCLAGRMFDDRVSYGGWPLDRHDPMGMENPTGNGYCPVHPSVPIYTIPFRILYSKNVPNLMMAGRNVSVTHVALGSVRVEATIMTMGQAAGTAAALMLKLGQMPHEYAADTANIHALQQTLLKDDQYIPGIVNEDPLDIARTARVTASSLCTTVECYMTEPTLYGLSGNSMSLDKPRATCLPVEAGTAFRSFDCFLMSKSDAPCVVKASLYTAKDRSGKAGTLHQLASAEAELSARHYGVARFELKESVVVSEPFIWLVLKCGEQVSWRYVQRDCSTGCSCGEWHGKVVGVKDDRAFSFLPDTGKSNSLDAAPEYVVDGVSRPVGRCTHGWVSDRKAKLPQTLTLELASPRPVREVRLTFDSNLMPVQADRHPRRLVREYRVEGLKEDGTWVELANDTDNQLRHRVHEFQTCELKAVRIVVLRTWGDPSARIFEVRLY